MAETMLSHGPAARDGGERYQVVVTVGHDSLAGTDADGGDVGGEIDDGPWLSGEASRRVACDSSVVAMSVGSGASRSAWAGQRPPSPATSAGRTLDALLCLEGRIGA